MDTGVGGGDQSSLEAELLFSLRVRALHSADAAKTSARSLHYTFNTHCNSVSQNEP